MWDQNSLWKELKDIVKARWSSLTDDDVEQFDGRKDVLIGKIQQRYGIQREQAQKDVEEWLMSQPC